MKLTTKGKKHLFTQLNLIASINVLNALESNPSDVSRAWIEDAENKLSEDRKTFEVGSWYTKDRKPHVINFSQDDLEVKDAND